MPFQIVKPRQPQVAANTTALENELTALRAEPSPKPPSTPTPDLKEQLYEQEKIVGAYRMSWIRAGAALREISDRGLYRWKHDSFEEYLKRRWGWKKRRAYDLITAAGAAQNIREIKHALTASAAVKLAKLPPEQQAECLTQVIAATGTNCPQARDVAAAVAARLPQPTSKRRRPKKPKPYRIRLASGTLTILAKTAGIDLRALLEEALAQLAKPAAA